MGSRKERYDIFWRHVCWTGAVLPVIRRTPIVSDRPKEVSDETHAERLVRSTSWFGKEIMKHNDQETPKEVADACEMLAQQAIDDGDSESASLFMDPAHALRRVLKTLHRLNHRVHSGYDFNADPDGMTLEVGAVLDGYTPPNAPAQPRREGGEE